MTFRPPTDDQMIAMTVNAGIAELAANERFASSSPDMVQAIAEGVGAFAAGEWAPLNRIGDRVGAQALDGCVTLPDGFKEAYAAYVAQGWGTIAGPIEFGGQGLPFTLATCVLETLGAANMSFGLLPTLTVGATEALLLHGTPDQQSRFLPKLVSGEWSGTMNLTEPQAGSDVGALRTMAVPIDHGPHVGKFAIKGTKIFITFGEHDLSANIVHLVLARTPGAPAGSRGISLFIVPKYLVGTDGELGPRNDLRVVSIEHKLGLHASPTCVMSFGDNDACVGELVGREHEGLRCMFTMMNSARINVGSQGIQIAEAALQQAQAYARDRIQSPLAGSGNSHPVPIERHPDVRRMLTRMRALTQGARALLYYTAGQIDRGATGDAGAQRRADLLVPILKAWATDVGCEVASLGVQVHGGMGYIEETGAAQHYRDARITPIYEGTNGIQAADLVTRKLGLDGGEALRLLLDEAAGDCVDHPALSQLIEDCRHVATWMTTQASLEDRLGGSVPFLAMCGVVIAGWQLVRQQQSGDADADKRAVIRWFATALASEASGLQASAIWRESGS